MILATRSALSTNSSEERAIASESSMARLTVLMMPSTP